MQSRLLLGATLLGSVANAIHYFKGFTNFDDMRRNVILGKDGLVTRETTLVFSNKECEHQLYDLNFPFEYADIPDATHEFAQIQLLEPKNEIVSFFNVSDCATFVYIPRGKPLDAFEKRSFDTAKELSEWFWGKTERNDYMIENDLGFPIDVYWEARDNVRQTHRIMTMEPGEKKNVRTFVGHTFVFQRGGTQTLFARKVILDDGGFKLSHLLRERSDTEVLQRTPQEMKIWRGRINANIQRLNQNERQPPSKPKFTPTGFKKMKFPEETWKVVKDYHDATKQNQQVEGWTRDDTHVNFWESETTMNHLPEEIKAQIFDTLKPILEDWSGQKLTPTSCYGIRRYTNGSWLRDHADIGETHIVSAILNIDQEGMDEDWLLQILDHEGNRHYVGMVPGDLVLYESAVAIHGRSEPLRGKAYYGTFTHFMPTAWTKAGREEGFVAEE